MNHSEHIGPYTLRQAADVFPLCTDSLALGAFVQVKKEEKICDLGCGSGVLELLLLSRESSLHMTGLEVNPVAVTLAKENIRENNLNVQIMQGDLRQIWELLPAGSMDVVISNPPYFAVKSGVGDRIDRMERTCTMRQLCEAAGWLVKNGGRFALVHRPERLCDIFAALRDVQMEPKRMQFIQVEQHSPSAVMIEAYKQGRPGLQVLPVFSPDTKVGEFE